MARILYLIVGCIIPIFIGALHTFAHFKDLLTLEIQQYLQKEVLILGASQSLWDTWGIASFMMGISFIVIGLLNFSIFIKLSKTDFPPVLPIIIMILYLLCVIYVGFQFDQAFQKYGGMVGIFILLVCLSIIFKNKN